MSALSPAMSRLLKWFRPTTEMTVTAEELNVARIQEEAAIETALIKKALNDNIDEKLLTSDDYHNVIKKFQGLSDEDRANVLKQVAEQRKTQRDMNSSKNFVQTAAETAQNKLASVLGTTETADSAIHRALVADMNETDFANVVKKKSNTLELKNAPVFDADGKMIGSRKTALQVALEKDQLGHAKVLINHGAEVKGYSTANLSEEAAAFLKRHQQINSSFGM